MRYYIRVTTMDGELLDEVEFSDDDADLLVTMLKFDLAHGREAISSEHETLKSIINVLQRHLT